MSPCMAETVKLACRILLVSQSTFFFVLQKMTACNHAILQQRALYQKSAPWVQSIHRYTIRVITRSYLILLMNVIMCIHT